MRQGLAELKPSLRRCSRLMLGLQGTGSNAKFAFDRRRVNLTLEAHEVFG